MTKSLLFAAKKTPRSSATTIAPYDRFLRLSKRLEAMCFLDVEDNYTKYKCASVEWEMGNLGEGEEVGKGEKWGTSTSRPPETADKNTLI